MTVAEIGAMAAAAWAQVQNPAAQPLAYSIWNEVPSEEESNPAQGTPNPPPPGGQGSEFQNRRLQRPALDPSGFPGPDPKDGRLPEGQDGGPQELRILSAERFGRQGNITKLRGKVHLQYRGYDLYGKEIDFDHATRRAVLRGGAQIIGKDAVVLGETIEADFDKQTFRALQSAAEVRPGFLQGRTLDNVYLNGQEIWGSEREIFGHDCGLTTCTYDKPHYLLDSRDIDVRPNKRVILRHVRFEVLGKTLLNIPYLSIPLDTRREGYAPEIGRTPDQGYYIKTKWGVPVSGPNDLLAYVDYFEKLGLGLGGRFRYGSNRSEGYLRVYGLTGSTNTAEVQMGHKQLFGPNLFQIENNYQQRNYLNAPQNTLTTTRATMSFPQGRSNSRLSYYRSENESPTFHSLSQTFSLNDSRVFSERTRTNLDVSWVRSESQFNSGSSEREQVDLRFRGVHDLKTAQAELEYQRSIPVGETSNFFNASDRTPVLALRTDSNRLFGRRDLPVNFRTELSVGEFVDPVAKDQVMRTNFDIQFDRPDRGQRAFGIALNGRFKQGIYSDDTAQYAVGYGSQLRYSFDQATSLNFRYNYLEREGFTPLAIDRVGKTNLATVDLSYRVLRSLLVGAQTGYDFLLEERKEPTAWQSVGIRTVWRPREWFELRALPTYDTLQKKWSNIRLDLGYLPGATFVGVGARYDGIRKVWGAANIFVDALKWGRLKTSTLMAYNGYLKKFETQQFSFTYDLHCAEAILQVRENSFGFRNGREIAFYLRLKAFPFDTPFGLNPRGGPIGTATGRGF